MDPAVQFKIFLREDIHTLVIIFEETNAGWKYLNIFNRMHDPSPKNLLF